MRPYTKGDDQQLRRRCYIAIPVFLSGSAFLAREVGQWWRGERYMSQSKVSFVLISFVLVFTIFNLLCWTMIRSTPPQSDSEE